MPCQQPYSSTVSIIQSSGYGKSRMVNEMANHVFTLPFNLQDPKETKGVVKVCDSSTDLLIIPVVGAYSHPDLQVLDLLTEKFSPDPLPGIERHLDLEVQTQELAMRYHMFFKHLFDTVREKIELLKMKTLLNGRGTYWITRLIRP